MTRDEVIVLLGQISLVDDRVVRVDESEQEAQVRLWSVALRAVPFEFAGEAVGMHYGESAWPIMPKDIAERWRRAARDRLERHVEGRSPVNDPDDTALYLQALRSERAAVVTGRVMPTQIKALTAGVGRSVDELVPANEGFLAAKAAMWPKHERPAALPELAVHCPACGASPHRPCHTTHGRRPMTTSTHGSRQDMYAAARAAESEGDPS